MASSDQSSFNSFMAALSGKAQEAYIPPIKIAIKRSRHSARFAERIQKNAELADNLLAVIKSLNRKQGTANDVDKLLDITKDLLDNNAKLREQVGEALQDIPN